MPFHSRFLQVDLSVFNPFGNLPKALRRLGFSFPIGILAVFEMCLFLSVFFLDFWIFLRAPILFLTGVLPKKGGVGRI